MHYLKISAIGILLIGLINCGDNLPATTTFPDYFKNKKETDPNRKAVLDRARSKYTGPTCEEEDDRTHECVKQCRILYTNNGDRRDCEEDLTVKQIAVLAELYELLKEPNYKKLEKNITKTEDLEVYLNLSLAGFDGLAEKYKESEAEDVLLWITKNKNIAELFEEEDDDFVILKTLLEKLAKINTSKIHLPFIQKIDSSEKLMEAASTNENAINWFNKYILEEGDGCADKEISAACFTHFCQIGNGIDDDAIDEWSRHKIFEKYLVNIIDDEINKSNWMDGEHIDSIQDIKNNWVETLCSGL